ncbi:hypothetical protein AB433_00375 [Croceicoccus naphthovorans]|uniref:Uncharacterized protein n=2 Tax=Croceicoccus naphthovorans TaxID=1348774 RepID=A0A0G3XEJ0_9SPHN|nr:hypothetical protein AB433_00375 [Croceicoccus naphthovorans]
MSKDVANDYTDALSPWIWQQAGMADEPLAANIDHDPGYDQLMDALLGIGESNLDTDVLPGQAAIVAEVIHDALADAFQINVIDDLVNAITPIESGSAPVPDRLDVDFSDLLAASLNVSHVSDGIPFHMVQTADDIAVQVAQNA